MYSDDSWKDHFSKKLLHRFTPRIVEKWYVVWFMLLHYARLVSISLVLGGENGFPIFLLLLL